MPEEFKNAAIFLDWPIYYMIIVRFQKVPFSKCFLSIQRQKTSVFKFILFEEFLVKLFFHAGLVWTVRLTIEIKPCFQLSLMYIGYCLALAKCFPMLCTDNMLCCDVQLF